MLCNRCGAPVAEDSAFCRTCGARTARAYQAPPPTPVRGERKEEGGGFWTSPWGITLIIVLGVLVVGGVVLGVLLGTAGGPDDKIDNEILKIWDEFREIVGKDAVNFEAIDLSPAGIEKSKEDLKETRAGTESLLKDLAAFEPSNEASTREYKELAATLGFYGMYTAKTADVYNTVASGQLLDQQVVKNLNTQLAEMQKLGTKVKVSALEFLKPAEGD